MYEYVTRVFIIGATQVCGSGLSDGHPKDRCRFTAARCALLDNLFFQLQFSYCKMEIMAVPTLKG